MFTDFEWCEQSGSLFGLMPCNIDSSNGIITSENGANIEFTTINVPGSNKWKHLSSKYKEVLSATFQVCKNPCLTKSQYFSTSDLRFFNRWLNRNDGYHKFKINHDDNSGYPDFYFNSYLNVKKIELGNMVIGLEITVTTDAPYAYFEPKTSIMNMVENDLSYTYLDISDEVGHLYPHFVIKCNADGDLIIRNNLSGITSCISGCVMGEIITIDSENKIISSNIRGDSIIKSFNFGWLDIMNTYDERKNKYTSNLPCTVTMTYSPIAKIGL